MAPRRDKASSFLPPPVSRSNSSSWVLPRTRRLSRALSALPRPPTALHPRLPPVPLALPILPHPPPLPPPRLRCLPPFLVAARSHGFLGRGAVGRRELVGHLWEHQPDGLDLSPGRATGLSGHQSHALTGLAAPAALDQLQGQERRRPQPDLSGGVVLGRCVQLVGYVDAIPWFLLVPPLGLVFFFCPDDASQRRGTHLESASVAKAHRGRRVDATC